MKSKCPFHFSKMPLPYLDLVPELYKRSAYGLADSLAYKGLAGLRGKRMPYMNLKGLRGKRTL
ncbi:unnamed protein product [Heligmosomoides polygyrus]|uniref:NADH-quinone oxidoreductase subunit F n=1 Tax=Heligmosomoides polygyrus TaxID=6339 RepID=A0A183F4A3_HELPZ|nr:unnamed protein product [Heligmosomoides polygyrus]